MKTLSFSSLEAFRKCKLYFKKVYIDGIKMKQSKEMERGEHLHETIKAINKFVEKLKNKTMEMSYEDIEKIFDKNMDKFKADYEFYVKSLEAIKKYAEELFVSRNEIFKVEYEVKINTDEYELIGVIDRLDNLPEGMEIWDFKTMKVMNKEELEGNLQLNLYAFIINKIFSPEKIFISQYSILSNIKNKIEVDKSKFDNIDKYLISMVKKINEEKKFEPSVCDLCEICDKCNHYYRYMKEKFDFDVKKDNLNDLLKKYDIIRENKKILEKLEKEIKDMILTKTINAGGKLTFDDREYIIVKRHRDEVVIPATDYEILIEKKIYKGGDEK
jgi:RecB family exonuclease